MLPGELVFGFVFDPVRSAHSELVWSPLVAVFRCLVRLIFELTLRQPFRNLPHGRPRADLPALPATGEVSHYQF